MGEGLGTWGRRDHLSSSLGECPEAKGLLGCQVPDKGRQAPGRSPERASSWESQALCQVTEGVLASWRPAAGAAVPDDRGSSGPPKTGRL